jgi:hypothetical protein
MIKIRNIASCQDCKKLTAAAMSAYDKAPGIVQKSICDYHQAAIQSGVSEQIKLMKR